MRKKLICQGLLLTIISTPVLTGCVVTPQDMKSLNLRLRSIDNRLVSVEKDVTNIKERTGSSVELMQKQQAGIGVTIDQLNTELLQVKSNLDESEHRFRSLQAENTRLKEEVNSRFATVENQTTTLYQQVDQVSSNIDEIDKGLQGIKTARIQEATAKADVAARAATRANEQAELARKKNEFHEITPQKAKKTPTSGEGAETTPEAVTTTPKATSAEQQSYDKALSSFKAKKYKEAYNLFSGFIDKYSKSKLAVNARFWSGDCLYNQKEYALAILEYQNVIADYPNHIKAPASLYKQALSFEKLQDTETAKIVYNKIVNEYPKSEQEGKAKDRLKKLGQ
jgi:tol-pal system protein YbgF